MKTKYLSIGFFFGAPLVEEHLRLKAETMPGPWHIVTKRGSQYIISDSGVDILECPENDAQAYLDWVNDSFPELAQSQLLAA
jgi:hypothetical protein